MEYQTNEVEHPKRALEKLRFSKAVHGQLTVVCIEPPKNPDSAVARNSYFS